MMPTSPAGEARAPRRPVATAIKVAGLGALLTVMAATAWIITARQLPVPAFETVRAAWRPSAAYLVDRHGQVLAAQRIDFGARRLQWVPLESISPALLSAVIDAEDRRFHQHHGVDLRALPGALYYTTVPSNFVERPAYWASAQVGAFRPVTDKAGLTAADAALPDHPA